MDRGKAIGGGEYERDLFLKLKALENKKVRLYLKPGTSKYGEIIEGSLNYVDQKSAITGKPWVIIDFGQSETFDIDQILNYRSSA